MIRFVHSVSRELLELSRGSLVVRVVHVWGIVLVRRHGVLRGVLRGRRLGVLLRNRRWGRAVISSNTVSTGLMVVVLATHANSLLGVFTESSEGHGEVWGHSVGVLSNN